MIVAESHRGRRLVGRLDRGADLLPALTELATAHHVRCAEVRAFGSFEEVDLREFDQRMRTFRAARRFTTPFTLVQLIGNLAERDGHAHLEAQVTLSREGDNGIELIGGHLLRARVYAVDFVLDAFDDVMLRRALDPATGLTLISHAFEAPRTAVAATAGAPAALDAAAPAASHVPFEAPARGHMSTTDERVEPAADLSWADVAAVSSVAEVATDEDPTEDPLQPGDVIDHPKFGRCEVERIEGDSEFAQVRLKNQRVVRLSLDVLRLVRDGEADDGKHRRYRAVVAR